jgi:hypothetical protein
MYGSGMWERESAALPETFRLMMLSMWESGSGSPNAYAKQWMVDFRMSPPKKNVFWTCLAVFQFCFNLPKDLRCLLFSYYVRGQYGLFSKMCSPVASLLEKGKWPKVLRLDWV